MCCFAGSVRSVSDTSIFARLSGTGTQFLAYEMRFESDEPNAMILPLPVRPGTEEADVRFIDLSGYDRLFRDLRRGFPSRYPVPMAAAVESSRSGMLQNKKLVVQNVGDFEASFVPSMEDFRRLDPRFSIAPETWRKIPAYKDYGFAVFQLKALSGKPHPMAFEFPTRLPDTVFFPTVHIHDGEVHSKEHFDHDLFCQHPQLDRAAGGYTEKVDPNTQLVRSDSVADRFVKTEKTAGIIDPDLMVHRRELHGNLTNNDTWISTRVQASAIPRSLLPFLPWVAVATATGWFLNRRQRLSSRSGQTTLPS